MKNTSPKGGILFLGHTYILQPCGLQNVSAIVTTQNSHTFDP